MRKQRGLLRWRPRRKIECLNPISADAHTPLPSTNHSRPFSHRQVAAQRDIISSLRSLIPRDTSIISFRFSTAVYCQATESSESGLGGTGAQMQSRAVLILTTGTKQRPMASTIDQTKIWPSFVLPHKYIRGQPQTWSQSTDFPLLTRTGGKRCLQLQCQAILDPLVLLHDQRGSGPVHARFGVVDAGLSAQFEWLHLDGFGTFEGL